MPTYAVTGATGHLGRLVVDALLTRGIAAASVVALVRDPAKAADLAGRGVAVREFDYDRPATLAPALAGVDRLLLVSSDAVGQRERQHGAVIDAARDVGVGLLAYTSVVNAGDTEMLLAADHRATEKLLAESGLPAVVLRNGWYTENFTDGIDRTIAQGGILGSAGDGVLAPAPRADFAEAAATVLTADGQGGAVYELAGDTALTHADIAALLSDLTGSSIAYRDVPFEENVAILTGAGLPEQLARVFADTTAAAARGELTTASGDLARLLGRPTTPVADAFRAALTR